MHLPSFSRGLAWLYDIVFIAGLALLCAAVRGLAMLSARDRLALDGVARFMRAQNLDLAPFRAFIARALTHARYSGGRFTERSPA